MTMTDQIAPTPEALAFEAHQAVLACCHPEAYATGILKGYVTRLAVEHPTEHDRREALAFVRLRNSHLCRLADEDRAAEESEGNEAAPPALKVKE